MSHLCSRGQLHAGGSWAEASAAGTVIDGFTLCGGATVASSGEDGMAGFDQIPTGSNWSSDKNMGETVRFVKGHCDAGRIRGFIAAPWVKTLPQFERLHEEQIDQVAMARSIWR